jgi:hypothetical protein
MTLRYAAPEQRAGEPVGPAADVYALGLILSEMTTITPPPSGKDPAADDFSGADQEGSFNASLPAEVPWSLIDLTTRCLESDPAARPAAAEVAATLSLLTSARLARAGKVRSLLARPLATVWSRLPTFDARRAIWLALLALMGLFGALRFFTAPAEPWTSSFFYIATHSRQGTEIRVFPSAGSCTYRAPIPIRLRERYRCMKLGNFDDDEAYEILASGSEDGRDILIEPGGAPGQWTTREAAAEFPYCPSGYGDFNKDGYQDWFGWNQVPGTSEQPKRYVAYTSLGGPGGSFNHIEGSFDPSPLSAYMMVVAAHAEDISGDGCPDLVFLRYESGGVVPTSLHLLSGDCLGGFSLPNPIKPDDRPGKVAEVPLPANGIDVADLNGDGKADVIVGLDDDGDPGQCWILEGTGTGLKPPREVLDVFPNIESGQDMPGFGSLATHDCNGDNIADLMLTYGTVGLQEERGEQYAIDVRVGTGAGTFASPSIIDVGSMPSPKMWNVTPR